MWRCSLVLRMFLNLQFENLLFLYSSLLISTLGVSCFFRKIHTMLLSLLIFNFVLIHYLNNVKQDCIYSCSNLWSLMFHYHPHFSPMLARFEVGQHVRSCRCHPIVQIHNYIYVFIHSNRSGKYKLFEFCKITNCLSFNFLMHNDCWKTSVIFDFA